MHPIIKSAVVILQAAKTVDELTDGQLRKKSTRLLKKIIESKVIK